VRVRDLDVPRIFEEAHGQHEPLVPRDVAADDRGRLPWALAPTVDMMAGMSRTKVAAAEPPELRVSARMLS
jgi:hypothetical protein